MMTAFHYTIHTALITFLLLEIDGSLSALSSPAHLPYIQLQVQRFCAEEIHFQEGSTPLLHNAEQQLQEYFSGLRRNFDLPIKLYGTEHQQRVWQELQKIPYGHTCSYGDIAHALGQRGAQAVGSAVGKNPLPIIVPCHRVLPADGSLGQFSMEGGSAAKAFLLDLEKAKYKY